MKALESATVGDRLIMQCDYKQRYLRFSLCHLEHWNKPDWSVQKVCVHTLFMKESCTKRCYVQKASTCQKIRPATRLHLCK